MINLFRDIDNRNKCFQAVCCLLAIFASYWLLPAGVPEAGRRVFVIFVFAALFWALEIIPLYATSLCVVLLEVFLLSRPGGVLGFNDTGYKVFLLPFGSPIIMLFFGGFVLAQALQKYTIDKWIASRLLKLFGSKPYAVMFGFMLCTAILSMWMSNTATTAMMIAMVGPLLKQIDKDAPFRTGLILSIPFAANIGGMGTPVGTPPNAIAIGILTEHGIHLDFLSWMKMAVPLVMILLVITSGILILFYPPRKKYLNLEVTHDGKFDHRTKLTMTIAVLTILLWLTSSIHKIPSAVIALLAAGLLAATKLMDRDDFKKLDWDVLVLMWGGLALGKGMDISGLTGWIVQRPIFEQQGFVLVMIFCFLAMILSTFMSNTATANLIIPIVFSLPGESHILLVTTVALSCSVAMALPVSTPPNAIAFSTNMLKSGDMLKTGALVSAISVILILIGFKFVISRALGL